MRDEIQRTNYDVVLAVAIKDAEHKVLTLAERLVDAYSNELGAGMAMTADKEREKAKLRTGVALVALYHGVEELRRVREQGAG